MFLYMCLSRRLVPLFSIVPLAEASLILAAAATATCPSADRVLQRITLRTKAAMIPTFLYGTEKWGLYYDLMHMTKRAGNMQKPAIIIPRLSLFVSSLTSSSFFSPLPPRRAQIDPPRRAPERSPSDSHRERPHQSVHHDPVAAAPREPSERSTPGLHHQVGRP